MEDFKINIEGIQGQLHLTQENLAKKLNINVRTLRNKVSGKTKWTYDEISLLAEMVGVPIDNIDTQPILDD